jgi:hypothetical protein
MIMLTDAGKDVGSEMQVLDVAEIVLQALVFPSFVEVGVSAS